MKKMGLLFFLFLSINGIAQKVTFMLTTVDLPDSVVVYIAGSQPEIGNWRPNLIPMVKGKQGVWSKSVTFDGVPGIEYKFTLGSWENEGAKPDGTPLSNANFRIIGDTTVHHHIEHWTSDYIRINKGQITGEVKYHRDIGGDKVKKRDLIVWLPPNYNNEPEATYPVVYMHDGQNIIDPNTSSYGTDWSIDETCDSLIQNNKISPIIIVGIYNTTDRNQEYHPGKKGTNYMQFVVEKVKPLIDSIYRTKSGREHTLTGGSSSGGIVSFMLAWEYSEIFSKALCMSPAFKIGNVDYVKKVAAYTGKKKALNFYIDNGGVGLELELQPGIDDMMKALHDKGFIVGRDFIWVADEEAQHNEAAWAKRFPEAIEWLLNLPKTK